MKKSALQEIQSLVRSIIDERESIDTAARLGAIGYASSPVLADTFEKLARIFCVDRDSTHKFSTIIADFLEAPHPEHALLNLLRYVEMTGAPGVLLSTAAQGKPLREILATTFGSSQYMADIIIRNPGYLYWLIERQTWERQEATEDYATELAHETEHFNTRDAKLNAIRRFQRKAILKIGVRDLLAEQSIEVTAAALSDLAEAIVSVVLGLLYEGNGASTEPPGTMERSPRGLMTPEGNGTLARLEGFAVLALGKLGGRELNYSSDIDLIYICEDSDDETLVFYHGLAQSLTEALSEVTGEGYLYRVDLRLRPDGDAGPLINTLTSMRIYYESRGKPWEFQAMLRARVIAGDRSLGSAFLESISHLIENPSLPYSPVEAIAQMRLRIREYLSLHERSFNIKLMEGGIRDIEFIVQTIQLLHGARYPDIRVPGTLDALERARKRDFMKKREAKTLADAYRFLRLVEHRLQMMHQIKTHTVPASQDEVALLARRVSKGPLGTYSYETFIETLTEHLNNVRIIGESFFSGEKPGTASLLLLLPEGDPETRDMLKRYGIVDPDQAIKIIHTMAYGTFPHFLDRSARAAFEGLLPHLLEGISATGDPGATLANISRIASAGGSEHSFYRLLRESEGARALVVAIAGVSSVLTSCFCRRMEAFDALLVDPRELIQSSIDALATLDGFKAFESPRAPPLPDIPGAPVDAQPPAKVQSIEKLQRQLLETRDRLHLAAFLVDFETRSLPETLTHSRASFANRAVVSAFDRILGRDTPAALFALGSFGVSEPRFGSDADLLVVTDTENAEAITRGVQTIHRIFTEGTVLKLDFRLRGEGANAPLIQDIRAYETYFRRRMSLWERIAYSKCRFWWGDPAIAQSFLSALGEALAKPFTKAEIESLIEMRRKLESLAKRTEESWETKRSAGGRYDIEYLSGIGIAQITEGGAYPFSAGTTERLGILKTAGLLEEKDLATCGEALSLYGRLEYILELQGFSLPHTEARETYLQNYADRTFGYLGLPLDRTLPMDIKEKKRAVRGTFDHFLERVIERS